MEPINTAATPGTAATLQPTKDERLWGLFCHLSSLIGFLIPFGNIIGPLVVWLIKKDTMPFVDDQGREALNFQISITIYVIASIVLIFVIIGIPLLIVVGFFDLIMTVIAAVKANDGVRYRYPLTIRFIK